jgi:REP element-mobilizing transposase RayT
MTDTVVDWIDIFTRPTYKHIILESLQYCQQHKGLIIHAWVLMSNHLHTIVNSPEAYSYSSAIDYAGGKGLLKIELIT